MKTILVIRCFNYGSEGASALREVQRCGTANRQISLMRSTSASANPAKAGADPPSL